MGTESHGPGRDGFLDDGVSNYPASAEDLARFEEASDALADFKSPRLKTGPNSRLFIAAFDGTGNDAIRDPEHATNIGTFRDQILKLNETGDNSIRIGYVEGIGTQSNGAVRVIDGAFGGSFEARLEIMYKQFIEQATRWRAEDPAAQISVADIGFSRGAEQAAAFARLVHDRGIQDPSGAVPYKDDNGVTKYLYTKPPLVPPGQVAQAVALFDPVGTGAPRNYDRRLPSSVISGLQLTSEDERRGLFKGTDIIDVGMTPDGRFLGLMLPGCHSDIGGGYHRNGLSIRAGNIVTDYLNSLSDTPFLHKRAEPTAPGMNVIHRSEEGMFLYRMWDKVDRLKDGRVQELAPRATCRQVADCRNAEPRDEALAARFEFERVRVGPAPADTRSRTPAAPVDATSPAHPAHGMLLQGMQAVDALDTRMGVRRTVYSDRLAVDAAAAAQAKGLDRIDHVVLDESRTRAFVVQGQLDAPPRRIATVDLVQVDRTDVAQSLQALDDATAQRARAHAPDPATHAQNPSPAVAFAR